MKQILKKYSGKKILFLVVCLFFLSAYPIYKNYINGEAIGTYQIYRGIIEKHAKFYNPWQYRILCPLVIEGSKKVYDLTIDKVFPIERITGHIPFPSTSGFTPDTKEFIEELRDPNIVKYLLIFLVFRFIEDLLILLFSFFLLNYFIKNLWLVFLGLVLISWSMGNGVAVSPLSFDTYLDNALYLLAGCIILYKKNPWYILPVTIAGAINRETSLLIPYLLFVSNMHFKLPLFSIASLKKFSWPNRKIFVVSFLSFLSFAIIFISIRIYFGYQPPAIWKVPAGIPMLRLNILSPVALKGYFEMFGAFSILPLICLYKFNRCPKILQIWFIAIVPVWFFVHFYSAPTYQSRLFFVPTFLIFIPMVLSIIQKNADRDNRSINKIPVSTARYTPE